MQDILMQGIPIDEFLKRDTVAVDLFLRLKTNKYILIAKSGTLTPVESMNKYKTRKVNELYVRIEDYRKLIVTSLRAAHDVAKSKEVDELSRLVVLQEAMVTVYREITEMGFDEVALNHAKLVNHAALTFIAENPVLAEVLDKYGSLLKDGTKHSMMVSMISTMIGMGHDWVKPATLEKLSIGGFLHDVGKTKIPHSIMIKSPDRLTRDEKIIYDSHCEVGRQILLQAKGISEDIVAIAFEHHERADGSGFPRQLKDFQINPLARVVCLANVFVERVCVNPGPYVPDTAKAVFDDIELNFHGMFNKDGLKVLRKLLNEKGLRAAG